MMRCPAIPRIVSLLGAILASSHLALAHVGPPFPILVDQPIPGHIVTVWADPDVGEAVFYIVLEPEKSAAADAVSGVEVWVQPVTGRLPKAVYRATLESSRGPLRFVAKPEFDVAEPWTVGVDIRLANGTNYPFVTQVVATPPGLGPWDLLIYLFPFVLFGGLWVMVFLRRTRVRGRRQARAAQ